MGQSLVTRPITDEDGFDPASLIRIGSIDSVDLQAGMCIVAIDDLLTPPIRWMERAGGTTRTWSPPALGEQVLLICPYGELAGAMALRGLVSDQYPHIGSTVEEAVEFDDGARIAYDPVAHRLTATLPSGSSIDLAADEVVLTGNLTINGNVSCSETITADADVIAAGKSLKSHRHIGVAAGGAQSGPPA